MPQIACLGVLVADLLGRPIDDLPQRGRLGLVDQMELHIGGCAANTGIDLVKLGIETAVLGKVGADGLGDYMVGALQKTGIDMRGVIQSPDCGTSASMVLIDSEGERTFLHYTGGNARYKAEDVAWDIVKECRILHIAGSYIMPDFDGQPTADTLRQAREFGLMTSLDVVWDGTLEWKRMLCCLPHIDVFTPSLAEAQQMTGRTEVSDVASALLDAGVKTVALKTGPEGCYVRTQDSEVTVPGFRVEAVDGTGSGDAFDAGFLVGIVNEWGLERTARFANAVGALCVTAIGATGGVKSFAETEAFIAEKYEG
jgi:sugar/nucleoside kinase (ribokinase family)